MRGLFVHHGRQRAATAVPSRPASAARTRPDLRHVERPQPRPVGLPADDLGARPGVVLRRRRRQREIAGAQRRQRLLRLEVVDVREHLLEDGADRVATDGRPARREAEDGVGLVELGQALGVAGVRPLDEEARDVLGLGRPLS